MFLKAPKRSLTKAARGLEEKGEGAEEDEAGLCHHPLPPNPPSLLIGRRGSMMVGCSRRRAIQNPPTSISISDVQRAFLFQAEFYMNEIRPGDGGEGRGEEGGRREPEEEGLK